jgi:hypothetical protein
MNDQIRNLILTAQQQAAKETIANSFAYEHLVYAKFAELIVTKCAVIATRCEANGTKNIGAEILDHFGVE